MEASLKTISGVKWQVIYSQCAISTSKNKHESNKLEPLRVPKKRNEIMAESVWIKGASR